jgi:hypothetical protein
MKIVKEREEEIEILKRRINELENINSINSNSSMKNINHKSNTLISNSSAINILPTQSENTQGEVSEYTKNIMSNKLYLITN